jgi:hypothetical protein
MTATLVELPRTAAAKTEAPAAIKPAAALRWRAVIRVGSQYAASRQGDRVEWHLAGCGVPAGAGEHCTNGHGMMEMIGHPDGHCVIDGACGRCGQPAMVEEREAIAA